MKRASVLTPFALALLMSTTIVGCAPAPDDGGSTNNQAVTRARPPQFVLLAFDGSKSLPFWRESRAFARDNQLKFTYFISGVYFVPDSAKRGYDAPRNGAGKSAIGFGGEAGDIAARYEELRLAHAEGNEIASHANGHFDGSSWSEADWSSEFDQFDQIIFTGVGVTAPPLGFGPRDVVGFRAPQLAHSAGLFRTLPTKSYAYDTSKTEAPNYWPEKIGDVWNFPLARLRIVGSGKATLSMDYNFYVADSGGNGDAGNKEKYKKQMLDTYAQYFENNYFGNRAPLHLGHHFSRWNGGAYWEAMQGFAKRVCGLPEVQCVTYKELATYLESHQGELRDFQASDFTRMPRPPGAPPPSADAPPAESEIVPDSERAHEEAGGE